jgi:hypothetical protein
MALRRAAVGCLFVLLAVAACGPSGPSVAGDPSEPERAGSYAEYAAAICSALQSMMRAYGNPDTAALSPMYRAFDAAVEAGDAATATARAGEVLAELERGRASAGIASGWPPGASSAVQADALLRAFEAMVRAKLDALPLGNRVATDRGQAAFVAAGGGDAWYAMLAGIDAAMKSAHQPWPKCEGVPIGG